MNTFWKILQYGYLLIAIIFMIEAIVEWNDNRERSYYMIGFSVFITLIFFFKRHFRKKIKARNNQ